LYDYNGEKYIFAGEYFRFKFFNRNHNLKMIDVALSAICGRLNEFLAGKLQTGNSNMAILSNIIDRAGNYVISDNDSLVMTYLYAQEERIIKNANRRSGAYPSTSLNLFVMFTAFTPKEGNYQESLRVLSGVFSFFQANPVFNQSNTPYLPDEIEKLTPEIVNPEPMQISQLWGMNGGKHFPCIIYKFRMIVINEGIQFGGPVPFTGFRGESTGDLF
jgi:hypothetical protein